MRSFRSLAIIAAVLFISSLVSAQPGGGRGGERYMQELKTKLSLTDDQVKKVDAIMTKQREESRAAFDAADGDRDKMRETMGKITEKYDKEIEKILTKEQKPKFEELKKERRERMQQRMKERQQ